MAFGGKGKPHPRALTPTMTALLGFVALAAAMGVGRFAFTPLLPMMRAEGLLTVAEGGSLAAIHFLGYAIGAWAAGSITGAPRPALFISLILIALASFAVAATDSWPVWLVARWIAGVCSAVVLVLVGSVFVRRLAQARRAALQGIVFAGVGAGIAAVGLCVLGLMWITAPSWTGWAICGLIALVAAATMGFDRPTIRELPKKDTKVGPASGNGGRLAWRIIVPYGAMGFGYVIPATYLPVMAQAVASSPLAYGWTWPVFGVVAALSTVMAAQITRHLPDRQVWVVSQLVMAFGLVLPAVQPSLPIMIIAGICVGGTFMVITMVGIREAHRIVGSDRASAQIAAMTTAFAIGQMVGPIIGGWGYSMTGSFSMPLLVASASLAATAFLLMFRTSPGRCS